MNNNPYLQNLGYGAPSMGPQSMGQFGTPGVQAMPPQMGGGMGGAQSRPAPWHGGGPNYTASQGPHNFTPMGGSPIGGSMPIANDPGTPYNSPIGAPPTSGPMSFNTGGTQAYNPYGSSGGYMGGPTYPGGNSGGMGGGRGGLLGGWR